MTHMQLDRLSIHYPRQPAPVLDALSLTVESGELLALLGPSGSGKSTILKLIAGIETPDSGDIRFDGSSILPVSANRRGAVLMFQKAYLFPFMSISENISFGLKVQGADRPTIQREVARMLELVELPGIERKYPAQLSGGEQQRVALARALVTQPRVLLLDEPLSSLDTNVRLTLQEALRRVQREFGITTILVTHDLSEAIALSDRTALLLDGSIAACAPPRRLFQRPPTRKAARFVGVSTFFAGTLHHDRLATSLGTLHLPPAEADPPGSPPRAATLAIRPEQTHLHPAPPADTPNIFAGTVADLLYRGEATEYQVIVGGTPVRVRHYHHTQPAGAADPYQPGEHVYVEFAPRYLFPIDDQG